MANKDNIKTSINIVNLDLLDSHLVQPETTDLDKLKIVFNVSLEHKTDLEFNHRKIACMIEMSSELLNIELAKVRVLCTYHVENLDKFEIDENNEIMLPIDLGILLNSIAISTTRGIMFSELRGTYLHTVIFPIIDPKKLSPIQGNNEES